MSNLKEYEQKIDDYLEQIEKLESQITDAEKNLIVAETEMKATLKRIADLEEKCKEVTGKPIKELDNVIAQSIKEMEKIMSEIKKEE